ncbi:preprotein translocase subunit SecA [Legionella sp. W05-934-2]|jgi:preprotein translocase subunit SecA|uniref:preprotein translocase subunit SecA n=1 Tax=Legionella sp. W05-934-2 TaxID=1198649 RepID=UPI0034631C78
MLNTIIKKMFGSRNERTLRRLEKKVAAINAYENEFEKLTDQQLGAKTDEFKKRYSQGEPLESLLEEAFAVVREASKRTLGLRHFDVQLIGGMVLHEGNIAEMRTGEGKTLVGTLPAYLNAISGLGVHVVTVNDYLAKRDSQWMKPIYDLLHLSVGVIYPDMPQEEKKAAYQCDIVYGTNNEFGFDYLRDNMAFDEEGKVQGQLNFAIVDEVDSILIDEARTPLIISGASEGSSKLYKQINQIIPKLTEQVEGEGGEVAKEGDFTLDRKQKQAYLTESGHAHVEELLQEGGLIEAGDSLYHAANIQLMHHINAGLRANHLFMKDVDYIVSNGEVVIVDEHTGRTMPGRRWSDGLHQAVEAKEKVEIQKENQTLASITFQNFFRLYNTLSGMTGTADTEAYEFQQIYRLEVVVIPTNRPMIRKDESDLVYLTQQDKYEAIIEDVRDCVKRNQPVLVGTASIEASELLSRVLTKEKIAHQVLNAKFHEKEAQIIAEAGRPGAVTIATNMAGRGTDIVLGGNLAAELAKLPEDAKESEQEAIRKQWQVNHDKVIDAGGLRIIGSERHESRRIDNQLRGRAGRQGDPGSSRFYLSLEDTLMRIFTSERVANMMRKLGMKPGEPITHPLVTRAIENAQRKLEGYNFDVRKQLLEYDNVANEQRKVIYTQRSSIMALDDTQEVVELMRNEVVINLVDAHLPPESMEDQWDVEGLTQILMDHFNIHVDIAKLTEENHQIQPEDIKQHILTKFIESYQKKEALAGREMMTRLEKSVLLQTIDYQWREHLAVMDHLRQGIHLRGYAQKDPKQEYKREAFTLFSDMLDTIKYDTIRFLTSVELESQSDVSEVESMREAERVDNMQFIHNQSTSLQDETQPTLAEQTYRRAERKVGRNESCPCGSGKKYKNCHGSLV